MQLRPRRRRRIEINIVPLVDVLIVLIFFFLMTMQFKTLNILNITPPKLETAGQSTDYEAIQIAIDKAGTLFYNNQEISEEALRVALTLAINRAQPDQSVLVLADEDAPLKYVTLVMDQCRQANLEKVRLQTR